MKLIDGVMSWLNHRRLRDYPRMMLLVVWLILGINIGFRNGWIGYFGQVVGGDFIMFYSTGLLFREKADSIYDYESQLTTQQAIIAPTSLPGLNPFMNPPYVAPIYSLLTILPLVWSFVGWTLLMIAFASMSVVLITMLLPSRIKDKGLSSVSLFILTMSFFPFIESLQAGQNSGLTLLLMMCIVFFILKDKPFLTGISAGLLLYKPQYIFGFLIIWLVWKNYRAWLGFIMIAFAWIGTFYMLNGFETFQIYANLSEVFLLLPYIEGFPGYLLVTLYGLFTTVFPQSYQTILYSITQAGFLLSCVLLAYFAYTTRKNTSKARIPVITLAMILPLFATPYSLLHDLVILIPGFILWVIYDPNRELIIAAALVYLGTFMFTLISAVSQVALNSIIVISLFVAITLHLIKKPFHVEAAMT